MMQKYVERIFSAPTHPLSKTKQAGSIKFSSTRSSILSLRDQVVSKSKGAIFNVQKRLDTLFSIAEVRDAQLIVNNVEQEFLEARRLANQMKQKLADVRISLEEARKTLDRCPRDSENFLRHVAEEHTIINKERRIRSEYEAKEQRERELFTEYSNAVRVSHEKERERAQKTKYLSIIGSVSGAIVGFLGSSLITYYRLKQIRQMTSPDILVDKISHEIKENSLKKDELHKLFETNAVKLVDDLGEKLKILSSEKLHFTDVDNSSVNYADLLEETGKTIKNSEDTIKRLLDHYILKVSEVSQSFILDLQNSSKQASISANGANVHTQITSTNEKLDIMEGNIVNTINTTSSNVINEANKTLRKELTRIENNQKQLKEQMASARMLNGEQGGTEAISDMQSEATWYPEANLILSFFSFGLLVYLVLTKS